MHSSTAHGHSFFKDGIKERSHYCIARYLEHYVKKEMLEKKHLQAFERMLEIRTEVSYSTDPIEIEENLTDFANSCRGFIEAMRALCS